MPDLNLLITLDVLLAEGSVARAAKRLQLSPSAMSRALARLRETTGDPLLVRAGRGLVPTPRALALWPPVREALSQLQQSLAPGAFEPATAESTFVLAMADATAATLVPGLVEITEREAPGISIRVLPLTTRDPRRLLDDESADMAVGYFPAALADLTARAQSGGVVAFESRRLYDGEYVCVMRKGHPLANRPISLEAYCAARHLLVSFSGRAYGFVDEALAAIGQQRRIVLTVNQFFTAGRVVVNSDLLTVLPRHFVPTTGMAHELVLHDLPFDVPPVQVHALWHRKRQQDSPHQWLRAQLQQAARQAFGNPLPTSDIPT